MSLAVIAPSNELIDSRLLWWLKDCSKLAFSFDELRLYWLELLDADRGSRYAALSHALDALFEVRAQSVEMVKAWGGLLFCFDGSSVLWPLQGGAA